MFGFRKERHGRIRKIYFSSRKICEYAKPRTEKEIADRALQDRLEEAFWQDDSFGIDASAGDGVIVSLTSFGERAKRVHITLQSIFEQTEKAASVVLWLDEGEFTRGNLPEGIVRAQKRGLVVGFYRNLRSYMKIIPTLVTYPDRSIVTIDDDVMYPSDLLAGLLRHHERTPRCVLAYRAHQITFDEAGRVNAYLDWRHCIHDQPVSCSCIVPTGVGGVLYPPGCFDDEVLNDTVFMDLCPTADDIWLKAMTLKNDTECRVVPDGNRWSELPPFVEDTQTECLATINVKKGNDVQFKNVFDHYDLWHKLTRSPH